MSLRLIALVLALVPAPMFSFADDEPDTGSAGVLEKYLEASKTQQQNLRGATMEVEISAELPKLKKKGHLQALRTISRLGKITYDAVRFDGDNTIKKEIIARFLTTETEANEKTAPPITPQYYKFRSKGLLERNGQEVYVFQLTPKKKMTGTFKGELWLDKESCMTVREAGRLVKNPSVFIKQFDFVRTYEIRDGVAIPKQTLGVVETRLWGKAEMNISFSGFNRQPESASVTDDEILSKNP